MGGDDSGGAPGPVGPERSFWLHVPPPLLFGAAFLTGVAVDWLIVSSALPESMASIARTAGLVVLAAGGLAAAPAPILFLLRRTTLIPHGDPKALVTSGPFRVTRNPMYLGLVLAYLGGALALNVLWPLALLPLPLWVLNSRVIPMEEQALTEAFGDEYRAYQRRVRRWL